MVTGYYTPQQVYAIVERIILAGWRFELDFEREGRPFGWWRLPASLDVRRQMRRGDPTDYYWGAVRTAELYAQECLHERTTLNP